jgi:integrase
MEHFERVVMQNPTTNQCTMFREQAADWLTEMRTRSKPVAPSTLATWESCLEKWLYPNIGDTPLTCIKNLTMRNLVKTMKQGGLGASAQRAYTNVVKMVIASAVDDEGEALYPRKWKHKFIDLTPDDNPNRPWFTGDVVTRILANTRKPKYRVLFALCAATGLRFGEALGIKIESISPDASTIQIQRKAWRNQVHTFLKTKSGKREMDLHPKMTAMLKEYIDDRTSGLLFPTRSGKPLGQSNVLRRTLHPILEELGEPQCGVHAFRRFRLTHIREHGVPKDLEHFWMGHTDEEIGDIYSMLKQRVAYRKKWANQLGLGFEIPSKTASIGPNGPKIENEVEIEMAVNA